MDMTSGNRLPRRSTSVDRTAQDMWRIASGESCQECWETLPEDQKQWWRHCAVQAVKEWMANHRLERGVIATRWSIR